MKRSHEEHEGSKGYGQTKKFFVPFVATCLTCVDSEQL